MSLPTSPLSTTSVKDALSAYSELALAIPEAMAADPCATPDRSGPFQLENQSQWAIEIMFMQLKSKLQTPPGYTNDTGVFVAAKNVPASGRGSIDPCRAGGWNRPILGTWMNYNAKMTIIWNGQKHEQVIEKLVEAPEGRYLRTGTIRIIHSTAVAVSGPPAVELTVDFEAASKA